MRVYSVLTAVVFIFVIIFIIGCAGVPKADDIAQDPLKKEEKKTEAEENDKKITTEKKENTRSLGIIPNPKTMKGVIDTEQMYRAQAAAFLRTLSLEEKIGQILFISLWNTDTNGYSTVVTEWEKKQLNLIKPGGVILFGGNIDTAGQTKNLCDGLQNVSDIPLFIATDQEGGAISRLHESGNINATRLPPPQHLGESGNIDYAFLAGWVTGRELSALGINMDFAPVADLYGPYTHPVIAGRSFSTDPETAAIMSIAFSRGLRENGVIPVFKHFPGHGGAGSDPHYGNSTDPRGMETFRENDLVPFQKGIEAGIDMIMTAHILLPNITGTDVPASYSIFINKELLREELGFTGPVITDSIAMGAIRGRWELEESVVAAIKGGVDLILEPPGPQTAYKTLLKAVQNGIIQEKRIDESVLRILTVKLRNRLVPWDPSWGPDPEEFIEKKPEKGKTIISEYFPGEKISETGFPGDQLHAKINRLISAKK